jgi:hypothetical protein
MYDPTLFPYVRAQNYLDDNPPQVTAGDFYNPCQDALAQLFGAALGLSCSIATEEFDRESPGLVTAGGLVGSNFIYDTATNAEALSVSPIASGDHGIWKFQATAASPIMRVRDNMVFPGARRFIWTARVRFTGSANFETRANSGVVVGMWAAAADTLPAFRWGSDFAGGNWWAYFNDAGDVFIDTGVPFIDDEWYTLVLTRDGTDNKLRFYIGTGTTAPTLRVTSAAAFPATITGARRYFEINGTAGSGIGDGAWCDFYKRGIDR